MFAWLKSSTWRIAVATALLCVGSTWLAAWGLGCVVLKQQLDVDAGVLLTETTKVCGAFASSLLSAFVLRHFDAEIAVDRAEAAFRLRINDLIESTEVCNLVEIGAAVYSVTEASMVTDAPKRKRFAACAQAVSTMIDSLHGSARAYEMHPRFAKLETWTHFQRLSIAVKSFGVATTKTRADAEVVIQALQQLKGKG